MSQIVNSKEEMGILNYHIIQKYTLIFEIYYFQTGKAHRYYVGN